MAFRVGDRVRHIYGDEIGTVTEIFANAKKSSTVYLVDLEDDDSEMFIADDELELYVEEKPTYRHDFEYLDNVVIARFYEIRNDGTETELGRGHGHIIHDGAVGIAQAASYALKKLYEKLNDNQL